MCLRGSPPPVFLDGGRPGTTFLDDLFGWTLADRLRALGGQQPSHAQFDNPFGLLCGGSDSYLSCCFSSLWSFGVVLLAFAAGVLLPSRKKTAFAMLGAGAGASLLVIGIRVAARASWGDRASGPYRDRMFEVLPVQLAANLLFQVLLPFAVGLLLVRIGAAMRRLLARSF